jgi:hypothetical protein
MKLPVQGVNPLAEDQHVPVRGPGSTPHVLPRNSLRRASVHTDDIGPLVPYDLIGDPLPIRRANGYATFAGGIG